jgi:hypothetical protein
VHGVVFDILVTGAAAAMWLAGHLLEASGKATGAAARLAAEVRKPYCGFSLKVARNGWAG